MGFDPEAARSELAQATADLSKVQDPGDRANLQTYIGDLNRQLNNFGATPVQTIDNAAGIGALLSQPAAPKTIDSADGIAALLGPKPADTSDPEGNKDPRDYKIDQRQGQEDLYNKTMSPGGGWFRTAAKALMPTNAGKAGVDTALDIMTPRGIKAAGRAVLPRVLGMGGDFENAFQSTAENFMGQPTDPALRGHATALPTSEEFDQGLTRMGLPNDPYRKNVTNAVAPVAGIAAPLAVSSAMRLPEAMKVERLQQEAQQAVSSTARERATQLVDQHPMPERMPDVSPQYPVPRKEAPPVQEVRPVYPGPRADEPVPVTPYTPQPVARTAPATPSATLEGHIAENEARLGAEKSAAYEKYKAATPPAGIDLQDFKADLNTRIARAGTDEEATALRKVLNNVQRIESESDTQFESLDKLRRQLGKKAAYGETPSGYEAIGKTQARDLNKALGERMKVEHPAYAEYTKKYHDLSQEAEPSASAFLKQAGAKEGSADLVANALASPKNVDQTIAAIGPDGAKKLDALAVKHVQNQLGRKTGQSLEDAYTDLAPSLQKLPQARAAAEKLFQGKQLDVANEATVENLLKAHAQRVGGAASGYGAEVKGAQAEAAAQTETRMAQARAETRGALSEQKAASKAAETAAEAENRIRKQTFTTQEAAHTAAEAKALRYRGLLNNLQQDVAPSRRVSVLREMNDKMLGDGLINDAEHIGFGAQIERAANAADKQKALATLSKYVAYTLTGNYMISFGGPHLVSYLGK